MYTIYVFDAYKTDSREAIDLLNATGEPVKMVDTKYEDTTDLGKIMGDKVYDLPVVIEDGKYNPDILTELREKAVKKAKEEAEEEVKETPVPKKRRTKE